MDEWRGMRRSLLAAGLPLTHSSEKENLSLLILQKTTRFRVRGIIARPIAVGFGRVICDPQPDLQNLSDAVGLGSELLNNVCMFSSPCLSTKCP